MKEIDVFASELFEEAKRFFEKAEETETEEGKKAFLHAALLLGISSFEAHLNAISDEMSERPNLNVLDFSILLEQEYVFDKGVFTLTKKLKMYNLIDRYQYIYSKFSLPRKELNTDAVWWGKLIQGIKLRNLLVHPKEKPIINSRNVEDAFHGIIDSLDEIYVALYNEHFPAARRNFDSKMDF